MAFFFFWIEISEENLLYRLERFLKKDLIVIYFLNVSTESDTTNSFRRVGKGIIRLEWCNLLYIPQTAKRRTLNFRLAFINSSNTITLIIIIITIQIIIRKHRRSNIVYR